MSVRRADSRTDFDIYFEARCKHCSWSYGETTEDTTRVALMAVQHAMALHPETQVCPDCERPDGHDDLCGLNPKAVRV